MVATVETTAPETVEGKYNRLYAKGIAENVRILNHLPAVIDLDTPAAVFIMQGAHGDQYQVQVSKNPDNIVARCTCPAGRRLPEAMPCKHLAIAMDALGLLPDISDEEHTAITNRALVAAGDAIAAPVKSQLEDILDELEYLRYRVAALETAPAKPKRKRTTKKEETADTQAA